MQIFVVVHISRCHFSRFPKVHLFDPDSIKMSTREAINHVGDAMDDYLVSLGLFRKPVAPDETSLFRAASEQIYSTQAFHTELRECCDGYIARNAKKFEHLNQVPAYIHALAILYKHDFLIYQEISKPPVNVTNFGYPKKIRIILLSVGYTYYIVFAGYLMRVFWKSFRLHLPTYIPEKGGNLSILNSHAALFLALVYEILYKGVFHMDTEVDAAVGLIRKQAASRFQSQTEQQLQLASSSPPMPIPIAPPQRLPPPPLSLPQPFQQPHWNYASQTLAVSPYCGYLEMNVSVAGPVMGGPPLNGSMNDSYQQSNQSGAPPQCAGLSPAEYYLGAPATIIRRSVMRITPRQNAYNEAVRAKETEMEVTGPPFPYKVAKALDPVLYRNIEYDIWLEDRKANLHGSLNSGQFPPGTNCIVHLDHHDSRTYFGIVQENEPNGESAIVFLPRLGEKKRVHIDRIEACPRNIRASTDSNNSHERRSRVRRVTWAATTQPPAVDTNASSWPSQTNNDQQLFQPNRPFFEMASLNQGNVPITVLSAEPPAPYPSNVPGSVPQYPMVESSISHPVLLQPNATVPPPMQIMTGQARLVNAVPYQFSVSMIERQPTQEDLMTLRQFYEWGGCEYFRRYLAINQTNMQSTNQQPFYY